eukprot:CAMPEP_0168221698 /NCGR_PEP_ID=MMETSP0140_2-20121125/10088_1 /TAXON_ID=44445 /ORGANISM="Pseudo-nitzschia australis, Strain 10249 10 AB" /LENGTH=89 /DNA_ID=CAMNT_0008150875 /DNA_START=116 /DNA_END=385 /DNA_ORIENTATION=-
MQCKYEYCTRTRSQDEFDLSYEGVQYSYSYHGNHFVRYRSPYEYVFLCIGGADIAMDVEVAAADDIVAAAVVAVVASNVHAVVFSASIE